MASINITGGISQINWAIAGLGNPFNTTYYICAGIASQPVVSGSSSISAVNYISAPSSGTATSVFNTLTAQQGTYTLYGFAQAANSLFYPIGGAVIITVTGSGVVKIYNGSSWIDATPYVYTGSNWIQTAPYISNGSSWIQTIS